MSTQAGAEKLTSTFLKTCIILHTFLERFKVVEFLLIHKHFLRLPIFDEKFVHIFTLFVEMIVLFHSLLRFYQLLHLVALKLRFMAFIQLEQLWKPM